MNSQSGSHIALARKYRPKDFSQLVGQEALVTTLSNAIKNDKLHHAYILTGIRGVGKTSTARIIAKTINCLDPKAQETGNCCNECDNCISISNYSHQDVIEMDAASRTGVDDVREIIESVAYNPIVAKYKIYIIDEVHMLSSSAFNALLKTLEEPPKNVKFIFATTEIKKVPITILSRCQKFDLRRLSVDEMEKHVVNILDQEGYKADSKVSKLIAKYSEGSVRDALSILDQAISLNNFQHNIGEDVVINMLGMADKGALVSLFNAIAKSDYEVAIDIFNNLYESNSDVAGIVSQLMGINHDIVKSKLLKIDAEDYDPENMKVISELADKLSVNDLNIIWKLLSRGYDEILRSNIQRIAFEMLLIRICHINQIVDIDKIFKSNKNKKNLEHLENNCNNSDKESDLAHEILQNFAGAKMV